MPTVEGWRSRRLDRRLPRDRCGPWPGFEPATVRITTDAVVHSAPPTPKRAIHEAMIPEVGTLAKL